MIGYSLLFVWAVMWGFSLATNRDIFSPAKMYMFSVFFYFADIFVNPYDDAVTVTYSALLLLGLVLAIQESYLPFHRVAQRARVETSRMRLWPVTRTLWLLSAVPIAAQIALIVLMGGINGYVNTLGMRVLEHRGLGPVTMLIGIFPVINVVYFTVGLLSREAGKGWWLGYSAHGLLYVIIGLASGSRGALLNNVVLMLMAYHYLRRRVPLTGSLVVAAGVLVAASLIGAARNGIKMGDEGLVTGLENHNQSTFESSHFHYGLEPLVLVYSRPPDELHLGLTFATVFTNPIPRVIWPGKPETGGVVLTKLYTDDAWDGASNLSTGLIAESVLNFGWWIGVPFGFFLIWGAMTYVGVKYDLLNRRYLSMGGCEKIQPVLAYLFLVFLVTSLLCGEFTSSIITAVVGRLLPLAVIGGIIVRVSGYRQQNYRIPRVAASRRFAHQPTR